MFKDILRDLLIGFIALIIINIIGRYINFHIPLNILSIFLLGIFKLPGLIILLLILIL